MEVCEPSSQRVIFVPLARNSLKVADTRNDLAFVGILVNAGQYAELIDHVDKDDHVLHRLVTSVPSSAYHVLTSFKLQNAMSYPLFEARNH